MAEPWRALVLVIALCASCLPGSGRAAGPIDAYAFDDPAEAARYQALLDELRCPKCLNTNLAGSDAPIAADLRALVYRMVKEGESDAGIRAHLQARYGDFVLYDPPKRPDTWLLWLVPLALLVAGLIAIVRIARARSAAAPVALADAEAERLERMLADAERVER
jgi:cytochrome c-type biogenesis protein CcmH